jgi:hypothetical protein
MAKKMSLQTQLPLMFSDVRPFHTLNSSSCATIALQNYLKRIIQETTGLCKIRILVGQYVALPPCVLGLMTRVMPNALMRNASHQKELLNATLLNKITCNRRIIYVQISSYKLSYLKHSNSK